MQATSLTTPEARRRILRFLVVGGSSALVQAGLMKLMQDRLAPNVAFTISWVLSTLLHYLANRFWAMPSARHDSMRQLGEYLFTVAVSYVINLAGFWFCHAMLGFTPVWSTLCAIPPSTVAVFLLLNFRVFKARAELSD